MTDIIVMVVVLVVIVIDICSVASCGVSCSAGSNIIMIRR